MFAGSSTISLRAYTHLAAVISVVLIPLLMLQISGKSTDAT